MTTSRKPGARLNPEVVNRAKMKAATPVAEPQSISFEHVDGSDGRPAIMITIDTANLFIQFTFSVGQFTKWLLESDQL